MTLQILLYGCDDPTFVATVGPVQALKVPGGWHWFGGNSSWLWLQWSEGGMSLSVWYKQKTKHLVFGVVLLTDQRGQIEVLLGEVSLQAMG